ncbi:MAG TPA: biotin/lipoyl-containing protein [Terriglobia bacterium]|nr:biotin/lipoyl-containing protein [Terriglobia bacterium]
MIRAIKIRSDAQPLRQHIVEVLLDDGAPGKAWLIMDGVAEEVDWTEVEPGVYSFLAGNRSFTVSVRKQAASVAGGGQCARYEATTGGHALQIEVEDSRSRSRAATGIAEEGPLDILAPMPGRIAKLLVQENAVVAKGDGLAVIEAMKMQNEIRAPRAGKIGKVNVSEGEGVEMGARLLRLE